MQHSHIPLTLSSHHKNTRVLKLILRHLTHFRGRTFVTGSCVYIYTRLCDIHSEMIVLRDAGGATKLFMAILLPSWVNSLGLESTAVYTRHWCWHGDTLVYNYMSAVEPEHLGFKGQVFKYCLRNSLLLRTPEDEKKTLTDKLQRSKKKKR